MFGCELTDTMDRNFSIRKLQDARGGDLDLSDTVGAIFEEETDPRMRCIRVVQAPVGHDTPFPPASNLRPVAPQKRLLPQGSRDAVKRQRIGGPATEHMFERAHQDQPVLSFERDEQISIDASTQQKLMPYLHHGVDQFDATIASSPLQTDRFSAPPIQQAASTSYKTRNSHLAANGLLELPQGQTSVTGSGTGDRSHLSRSTEADDYELRTSASSQSSDKASESGTGMTSIDSHSGQSERHASMTAAPSHIEEQASHNGPRIGQTPPSPPITRPIDQGAQPYASGEVVSGQLEDTFMHGGEISVAVNRTDQQESPNASRIRRMPLSPPATQAIDPGAESHTHSEAVRFQAADTSMHDVEMTDEQNNSTIQIEDQSEVQKSPARESANTSEEESEEEEESDEDSDEESEKEDANAENQGPKAQTRTQEDLKAGANGETPSNLRDEVKEESDAESEAESESEDDEQSKAANNNQPENDNDSVSNEEPGQGQPMEDVHEDASAKNHLDDDESEYDSREEEIIVAARGSKGIPAYKLPRRASRDRIDEEKAKDSAAGTGRNAGTNIGSSASEESDEEESGDEDEQTVEDTNRAENVAKLATVDYKNQEPQADALGNGVQQVEGESEDDDEQAVRSSSERKEDETKFAITASKNQEAQADTLGNGGQHSEEESEVESDQEVEEESHGIASKDKQDGRVKTSTSDDEESEEESNEESEADDQDQPQLKANGISQPQHPFPSASNGITGAIPPNSSNPQTPKASASQNRSTRRFPSLAEVKAEQEASSQRRESQAKSAASVINGAVDDSDSEEESSSESDDDDDDDDDEDDRPRRKTKTTPRFDALAKYKKRMSAQKIR